MLSNRLIQILLILSLSCGLVTQAAQGGLLLFGLTERDLRRGGDQCCKKDWLVRLKSHDDGRLALGSVNVDVEMELSIVSLADPNPSQHFCSEMSETKTVQTDGKITMLRSCQFNPNQSYNDGSRIMLSLKGYTRQPHETTDCNDNINRNVQLLTKAAQVAIVPELTSPP